MTKLTFALLASTLLGSTAFAADMPVKAPIAPAVRYTDWSGIYVGGAIGYGWGKETLTNGVSEIDNLFGTGVGRVFNNIGAGTGTILQPNFVVPGGVFDSVKQRGFLGGGFAGAQKQLGNWVIGLEGDFYASNIKKSVDGTETFRENVNTIRSVLPSVTIPDQLIVVPGQLADVVGVAFVPGQNAFVIASGTVPGQTAAVVGNTLPQNVPITVTGVIPAGQPVNFTIPPGSITSTGNTTLAAGTVVTISALNGVPLATPQQVTLGAAVTGTTTVTNNGSTSFSGFASTATPISVTSTGNNNIPSTGVTGTANVQPRNVTVTGTAFVDAVNALVLGTAFVNDTVITVPGGIFNLSERVGVAQQRAALVTRTASLDTKVDELASFRGKVGITNIFSPDIMLYGTGGAAWGHFTKTVNLSQTTQLGNIVNGNFVPQAGAVRTDNFSSSTGDSRLGWVAGAGIDWKVTPNIILGALYLHYDFPKNTVTFSDGTNSFGLGTSRERVDTITGRLSVLFPIQ